MESIKKHLEDIPIDLAVVSKRGRPSLPLDSTRAVYTFLFDRIGYSRRPRPVPLVSIAKSCKLSYKQVRKRLEILQELKKIEMWTTKHPTQYKITYFRIVYTQPRTL